MSNHQSTLASPRRRSQGHGGVQPGVKRRADAKDGNIVLQPVIVVEFVVLGVHDRPRLHCQHSETVGTGKRT